MRSRVEPDASEYGVVLAPLGGVRVHLWNPSSNQWSS